MDQNTVAKITVNINRTVAAATVRLLPQFSVNVDNTCATITPDAFRGSAGLALSFGFLEFMKIRINQKPEGMMP